jgi:alkaline phosphatase D
VLFFSGDQIYEGDYGYGIQRAPMDMAALDYLRKWYCYGWAFRDILKKIGNSSPL